ncbi:hypothetical protein [Pedobacter aquatilis]|uniref:hypothetical protein n=1 Tax=Pedobacter aquatilis TaxID=351343 RepID=UPI002930DB9F|nr:hypothetical protein [Pedobacter aquatilis]
MDLKEQLRCGVNPYGARLAHDINASYPSVKAMYGSGNLYLHLPKPLGGGEAQLKAWLNRMIKTLPSINCPLERIQVLLNMLQ